MIPAHIDGSEVRVLKNNTTGSELRVIASRGLVFSCWRFSPEEIAQVQSGKPLWVVIRGELIPELTLTVGDRNQVVPPEIIKRARLNESIINSPLGEEVRAINKRKELLVSAVMFAYVVVFLAVVITIAHLAWSYLRG